MSREIRLDPLEDSRLVDGCLAGDARAWEALVRRHERLVYAVARSYRLLESDLGDVFQEVFAALVTTQRIARATALRRRREGALAAAPTEITRLAAEDPPVGADLERLEEQAMIRLALAGLPPRCRRLLEALYYEDPAPAYAELGGRLGLPIGSIGPTRARCLERLREALEGFSSTSRINQSEAPTFESGAGGPQSIRLGAFGERPGRPAQEERV